MARYCPLFSSSSGNSTYLATASGGVLVDVGVSSKRLHHALAERQIDADSIRAIFLTHEHTDHVSGLRVFLKQHPVPVYATRGTLEALAQKELLPAGTQTVVADSPHTIAGMEITAFATPHDSTESCGYRVTFPDERVAVIATDIGCVTDTVQTALKGADLVHIESNHDVRMLECGPYPYSLKQRILADTGHLSNDRCDALLPTLLASGTTRFVLAHLSRDNNTPLLAHAGAKAAFEAIGAREHSDYLLAVAEPESTMPIVWF